MTLAAKVNLLRLHFAAAAAAFMPIGDFSSFKRKRADSDQGSPVPAAVVFSSGGF